MHATRGYSLLQVSIVVPVYSGERHIRNLAERILKLRDKLAVTNQPIEIGELIFVDDGAIDNSAEIIQALSDEYNWVVFLQHSRNFGQHPATVTGILHSAGDWVATIDEDLQHPPEIIEQFLIEAIKTRMDIVYIRSDSSIHNSLFRDMSSKLIKRLIRALSGNEHLSSASSFRILRGDIARATASACGHATYLDVALTWFSNKISVQNTELKDHRYIEEGRSGYNFKSLLSHARRMLFTSELKPLRIAAVCGSFLAALAFIFSAFLIVMKIAAPQLITVQGWTTQVLATTFFGGVNLLLAGIILEYLAALSMKANGRPAYFTIDRSSDLAAIAYWESIENENIELAGEHKSKSAKT